MDHNTPSGPTPVPPAPGTEPAASTPEPISLPTPPAAPAPVPPLAPTAALPSLAESSPIPVLPPIGMAPSAPLPPLPPLSAIPPVVNAPSSTLPPPPVFPPDSPGFTGSHTPPPPRNPVPPVLSTPPPAPAPKSGRGWKILALLLFLGLGASMLMNFGQFIVGSGTTKATAKRHRHQPALEEVVVQDNSSPNKIAVIELSGVITSGAYDRRGHSMVEDLKEQFDAAAKDKKVKAILFKINSPGGEVLASDDIYQIIQDFQDTTGKPVIAAMSTVAASGGYYVAAPCRWIVANKLTITGSIGVIMHGWNYRGLMDKVGIAPMTYKSGKFKDMLSGERKESEIPAGEKEMVQGLIMETYGRFTNIVEEGRSEAGKKNKSKGRELAEDWMEYVDGRVFSGTQAYELGFVDELGNFDDAVDRAISLAGLSNANLVQYAQPFDFGDLFSLFGEAESKTVKIDLGVEGPKLQSGYLYYMYEQAVAH